MSQPADTVVQDLLAETRRLRIENERLRQEMADRERKASGPDPLIGRLEAENRRLRQELAAATTAKESLEDAVSAVLDRLERQ
jgi:regulator of replication initiation timing